MQRPPFTGQQAYVGQQRYMGPRPQYRPIFHSREQGWVAWAMENKFVMIILLLLFVIIVVPWLICDVLGLKPICTIISGIFGLFGSIFKLVGLN
jgi:hypothetical protein